MLKKLLNKRGESLTEALVAVLIIALSAAMLATMVSAAVNINIKANDAVADFFDQLTAAETGHNPVSGVVNINSEDVSIYYYGEDGDALAAYGEAGP